MVSPQPDNRHAFRSAGSRRGHSNRGDRSSPVASQRNAAGRGRARRITAAQQYFQLLDDAREEFRQGRVGWSKRSEGGLRQAALLDTTVRNVARMRSDAATYLTSFDLQESAIIDLTGNASKLAFSPDSTKLAVTRWHTLDTAGLWLVDVPSRRVIENRSISDQPGVVKSLRGLLTDGKKAGEGAHAVAYSSDGRLLAVGTRSGQIRVWDESQTPPTHWSWSAHEDQIWGLQFGPDDNELFSCSLDKTLAKWDVRERGENSAKLVARVDLDFPSRSLTLGAGASPTETIIACGWETWTTDKVHFFAPPISPGSNRRSSTRLPS